VLVALEDDPQVLAIIPTLGTVPARLARSVAALREQTSPTRVAVVVVLNTDQDVAVDPSVEADCTLLRPGLNLGWAGGLQLGRASSTTVSRLWLIQDDMTPGPGCLAALESELERDPDLAVVSPLVVDDVGMVPPRSCGGVLRREPLIDMDHWYPAQPTAPEEIGELDTLDYVPSRGMLVDIAAWDAVGGMFPGFYPVIWADVDFCTAVREAGRTFGIAWEARTRHEGHGSTPSPFVRLLSERHRDLYRTRWGVDSEVPRPARTPIPPALTEVIAIAAAALATDLAVRYSDLVRENEQAAGAVEEIRQLRASTSWRVTRPLRLLGHLIRRQRPRG
jgi:GT2 family glycosyltransferase